MAERLHFAPEIRLPGKIGIHTLYQVTGLREPKARISAVYSPA